MTGVPRVVFVGGTPRGLEVLDLLVRRGVHLVGVLALEEDPHERVRVSDQVQGLARRSDVPVRLARRLSDTAAADLVQDWRPDLVLVVGWRTILPSSLLAAVPLGCLAVHDSPLPRYRGFAPVNWAVINGETQWGVTLFYLDDSTDGGDIVDVEPFAIPPRAAAPDVYALGVAATVRVVERHLDGLLRGDAPRRVQDEDEATYACARTPEDGTIDWRGTTESIDRLVRGLTLPYPGARTTWQGRRLHVWRAEPVTGQTWVGRIPGRVVGRREGEVDVLTGDGVLRIAEVSVEDGEPQAAGEVIRSVKASLG